MQAGFAQKLAKLTTKRMDAWMDGQPAVREYLGARRIHAACFSLRASSRPALHFCDTVPAAWMQGNLLLLTDKVVWYSAQYRHHTGGPAGDEMKKQVDGPWHWQ